MVPIESFTAHYSHESLTLSPDGKHIAFIYEVVDNEVRLAIITSDMKKITASFGFGPNKHIRSAFWANNKRILMNVVSSTGKLDRFPFLTDVIAANIDGNNRKRLSQDKFYSYKILGTLHSDPDNVIVEMYVNSKISHKILNLDNEKLDLYAEFPRPKIQEGRIAMVFDLNSKLRLITERRVET